MGGTAATSHSAQQSISRAAQDNAHTLCTDSCTVYEISGNHSWSPECNSQHTGYRAHS